MAVKTKELPASLLLVDYHTGVESLVGDALHTCTRFNFGVYVPTAEALTAPERNQPPSQYSNKTNRTLERTLLVGVERNDNKIVIGGRQSETEHNTCTTRISISAYKS